MRRTERAEPVRDAAGAPASEAALQKIFQDMFLLSDDDLTSLLSLTKEHGNLKPLEQVALEEGYITADQRDTVLRAYLERQLAEMRRKLIGARIGSYHIIEEIACGGMGIVFRARQESPMFTRDTALKLMIAGSQATQEEKEQFMTEVKGLAGLSHHSLVHIFDSGIQDDLYYFSMELIDGWSLADIPGEADLSLARKVEIVRDIAGALEYLHTKGVVHRDVKPANIMVDRNGGAKLLDFGIAQFSADPRFRAVQAGTPYFMAPEVIEPAGDYGPIGPATDIYALGAVLYQLLVGRPVFESGTGKLGEVLHRTLHEPPVFPRSRKERIPAGLERIIARCLRKRAGERYASAAELGARLDAFLRRSRYRAPVWVAAAALLILAVVIGFSAGREPPPRPAAPDLRPFKESVAEIEGVDPDAAQDFRTRLARIQGLDAADDSLPGAVHELEDDLRAAWKRVAQRADDAARAAQAASYDIGVSEYAAAKESFDGGISNITLALKSEDDRTAFRFFKTATEGFERARDLARKEQLRREQAARRTEADAARREALEEERQLREEAKISYSDEARQARDEGARQISLAEERLSGSDFHEAKTLFVKAQDCFYRAKLRARAGFEDACQRLAAALEQAAREGEQLRPRLEWNLPAAELDELFLSIAKGKSALESRQPPEGEANLAAFGEGLKEARAKVDALERLAMEARDRARDVQAGEKLPAPVLPSLREGRKRLAEGRAHLERQQLEAARTAFASAARLLDDVRASSARLTAGMVWLAGGEGEPGLWIDRCEVSVRDYEALLIDIEEQGHGRCCPDGRARSHTPLDWREQRRFPDRPVVGVPLEAAQAYARWLGKELPSEAIWRRAAMTGPGGRPRAYPYGDRFDSRRSNADGAEDGFPGLAPVSSMPAGASACGCLHLSGNAAEWALLPAGGGVLLGGSYLTGEPSYLRGDSRHLLTAPLEEETSARRSAGFRCVVRAVIVDAGGEEKP